MLVGKVVCDGALAYAPRWRCGMMRVGGEFVPSSLNVADAVESYAIHRAASMKWMALGGR